MSLLFSSFFGDKSDSVVTEDFFEQVDDNFSDAPLACPPLDNDYLLSGTTDHLIASTCHDLDDHQGSFFDDMIKISDRKPKPIHGIGKSMRLLREVLQKKDSCNDLKKDGRKIKIKIKKKSEVLLRSSNDETFWQSKLESTRQRLRGRYQLEHKKRRTSKVLDPKDCPELPFGSHHGNRRYFSAIRRF